MDESGFYCIDPSSGQLLGPAKVVCGTNLNLTVYEKDKTDDGWRWFDTAAGARAFFGLPEA